MTRIVLLAGRGDSTPIVYNALARDFSVARVVLEDPVPRGEFLGRRIRRYGLARVVGQILFRLLVVPVLRVTSHRRVEEIRIASGLDASPIAPEGIVSVPSANAPEAIEAIRAVSLSLVVIHGTRILSREMLDAVGVPFVNVHAGITPRYRGVHGAYWALVQGDVEHCGVTVHRVDPGIDTGPVLSQARIVPTKRDNFMTYPWLQLAAAMPLLEDAVSRLIAGDIVPTMQPEGPSRYWTHPTIFEYLWNRLRRGIR